MLQKHYQRLGLRRGASKDKIKKAYRQKAKLFHPDRNNHPTAEQKFINLNLSYEILMDYVEGGAPTYRTTTNSVSPDVYKKTTYYQNTRFTIAEMEAAWERQRARERKEYEAYLNLPWYSPTKLFEGCLKSISIIILFIVVIPLLFVGIFVVLEAGVFGAVIGLFILLFVGASIYTLYNAITK